MTLVELRQAIDSCDAQIVRLLNERTRHVLEIGALKRAAGQAGLILIAHGPGKQDFGADHNLVVTKVDGQDYSWAGQKMDRAHRAHEWEGVSRAAIRRITAAWQVIIIDPEWGRNDVLWPVLDRATTKR